MMFERVKEGQKPLLIGAVHLPAFLYGHEQDLDQVEEWALHNVGYFVSARFDSVMIQDNTPVFPEMRQLEMKSVIYLSALCQFLHRQFPDYPFGLIIESNDAAAAVSIASACHFQYIRSKVFVGAMQKPSGLMEGNARESVHMRSLADRDVAVCCDLYDRMGTPLFDRDFSLAVKQARKYEADAVILTGDSAAESLELIDRARAEFPTLPVLIGGGVNCSNIAEVAPHVDGIVASTCLLKDGCKNDWDPEKIHALRALL